VTQVWRSAEELLLADDVAAADGEPDVEFPPGVLGREDVVAGGFHLVE
jgi:hypothetical protein